MIEFIVILGIFGVLAICWLTYNQEIKYRKNRRSTGNIPDVEIMTEKGVDIPELGSPGAAGFDLKIKTLTGYYTKEDDFMSVLSKTTTSTTLGPGERILISTGLRMKIPYGYELQLRSRSGLTLKKGLIVMNAPGTIDSDYLGDIGVIILNASKKPQVLSVGDKICQGVFSKIELPVFKEVLKFEKTKRGENGFGSTGV